MGVLNDEKTIPRQNQVIIPEYAPREHLSVSTLIDYAKCPRLYFYKKCGLIPRPQSNALSYGIAMHKAVPVGLTEGLDEAIEAFDSVWSDENADKKRNSANAHRSLSHFCFTHEGKKSLYRLVDPPKGDLEIDKDTSPYEVPFAIDIGLPIPLVGRIDGLVEHRDTGDLWGFEFKTTSSLTSRFPDAFEMNVQILTYALVLEMLTNKPIRGIMLEAMLVAQNKVDGLTHPVYTLKNHLDDILIWLQTLGSSLLDMEKRISEVDNPADAFPKDFTGCTPYTNFYYPGFRCSYNHLCRPADWRTTVGLYDVVDPDSGFTKITKGSKECPI